MNCLTIRIGLNHQLTNQRFVKSSHAFVRQPRTYPHAYHVTKGRAIAQAVSRRLPTAAVRGSKPDLGMWDFVMDTRGAGAGFLRELRFPLPIYIPSALHNHLHYHPRLAQ
jgi:hypothetical protein